MSRMVHLKSKEEIEIMKEGGRILREAVSELIPSIKEGMTTNQVDEKAAELIRSKGGEISFDKVPGYSWATCLAFNTVCI